MSRRLTRHDADRVRGSGDGFPQSLRDGPATFKDDNQVHKSLHLHVSLWRELVSPETHDFCAIFKWGYRPDAHIKYGPRGAATEGDSPHRRQRSRRADGLMFVFPVEVVDESKVVLPGTVRLDRLNKCPYWRVDVGRHRHTSTFEIARGLADGERGITLSERLVPIKTKLPEQKVKGGDDVVASVGRDERPRHRDELVHLDAKELIVCISLVLTQDQFVRFGFSEPLDGLVQSTEVLLGAPEFETRASRIHGDTTLAWQSGTGSNAP